MWSHSQRWEQRSDDRLVPTLRFSPYAWSKLLFLRDLGETEVGGFGISSEDDLFLIEDIMLIKQACTEVTVEFDDESVADFFDDQVDLGREPERFGRCWIHTHPGDSAEPSSTDEATFSRVFGNSSWAVMFILARGGETYARLKFGCGPGAELLVPVEIAWHAPFAGADQPAWKREYKRCVKSLNPPPFPFSKTLSREEITFGEESPELLDDWGFPIWNNYDLESERSFADHDNTDDPVPI
jgi:hypothetical protein